MSIQKSRFILLGLACCAIFLLACETATLLNAVIARPTRAPVTRAENTPVQKPTRAPDALFDFEVVGTPRCRAGDASASVVNGRVLSNNRPIAGAKIQASSGPGAEPISDEPAESDENGNFQVTFVCDGAACNGSFWIWMINENAEQISPFAQFIFDNNCRRGTVNFATP